MNPKAQNPPGVNIGHRIRAFRLHKRWKTARLAAKMGVPRTYVSKVENGVTVPDPRQVKRFSDALNVTIASLVDPDDPIEQFRGDPFIMSLLPYLRHLRKPHMEQVLKQAERITAMHYRMEHAERGAYARKDHEPKTPAPPKTNRMQEKEPRVGYMVDLAFRRFKRA